MIIMTRITNCLKHCQHFQPCNIFTPAIARNKRTRAYIFRILLRLRYRRSQWHTLGAWYKASALGRYVRGICPPIIV